MHRPFRQPSAPPRSSATRAGIGSIRRGNVSQVGGRRRLMTSPAILAQKARRRIWVLPLREAFLVHMDDFDRLLEFQLRRKLNAVVAAPAPPRRGRPASVRLHQARRDEASNQRIGIMPIQLRPDAFAFIEHF